MVQSIVVVIFVLLISAACVGSRVRKEQGNDTLISKDTSTVLKGLAILYVFAHHYWQLTSSIYNSHTFIGYIGVTIFLFIAGYVSSVSLRDKGKESLSRAFFIKKFVRLYIPYICVKIILGIWRHKSLRGILAGIIHIEDDWFLCAITVLYFLFFLTGRISCGEKHNRLMLTGIALYMISCAIIGLPFVWYNTVLAFYIGMAAVTHEERQIKKMETSAVISSMVTLILGIFTAQRFPFPEIISTLFSVSLACLLVLFLQKFQIQNCIFYWIGSFSWEFYLFQSTILVMLGKWISGGYIVYFLAALAMSVILGYIVNKMLGILTDKIRHDIR